MSEGSNTAGRIAELRKIIASRKGMIERAHVTRLELQTKIEECRREVYGARNEIRELGGKVRDRF